jgi:putative transposase
MPLRRSAHCVYDTQYHFVWVPKYRKKIFKGKVRHRAKALILSTCAFYHVALIECEVAIDHVHLLCSVPPSLSLSDFMSNLKSWVSHMLFREFPSLRKRFRNGSLWADGYFVRTVGDALTAGVIQRYISNHQKIHEEVSVDLLTPESTPEIQLTLF